MGASWRRGNGVTEADVTAPRRLSRGGRRRSVCGLAVALCAAVMGVAVATWTAEGAAREAGYRSVVILPWDASRLDDGRRDWLGVGIAEVLSAALRQHPAVVYLDHDRLKGVPAVWDTSSAIAVGRRLRASAVGFGRVEPDGSRLRLRPELVDLRTGTASVAVVEVGAGGDGGGEVLLDLVAALPPAYLRGLGLPLGASERVRLERLARPTRSERALELYSRGVAGFRQRGQARRQIAADFLLQAVELDPGFAAAQYALGLANLALGHRWRAGGQFRAAVQLDPSHAEAYKAIGDLFLISPRRPFEQAVQAYLKALELRPLFPDAHTGLGDARAAKGESDLAIASYQRALELDPTDSRASTRLGRLLYAEKGLYFEAVEAFERGLEADPDAVDARMGLGDIYEDRGLHREAIAQYQRVLELDPGHSQALYNLAIVHEQVEPRRAIELWERFIEQFGGRAADLDAVATARLHLKKLRAAVRD